MEIKVFLSIGLVGKQEDVIEVPDEELEGLSEEARGNVLDEYARDWAHNYIEYGWRPPQEPS